MDHVAAILNVEIRIECSSKSLKEKLISISKSCEDDDADLCLPFSSREELANLMSQLQTLDVPFGNEPAGWSPAAVFEQLRDSGLVNGKIKTIAWRGRGDPVYGEV